MPPSTSVDFEFERDGDEVAISCRGPLGNFVLVLPLDGATVFAASVSRVTDETADASARCRFQIQRARLDVSK